MKGQLTGSINLRTESYPTSKPTDLQGKIESNEVVLIDVRASTEFQAGHIAGAEHRFLGRLLRELKSLPKSKPVVVQCQGGGRSAIAASILQRAGYNVINMQGGYNAWVPSGLPTCAEAGYEILLD